MMTDRKDRAALDKTSAPPQNPIVDSSALTRALIVFQLQIIQ